MTTKEAMSNISLGTMFTIAYTESVLQSDSTGSSDHSTMSSSSLETPTSQESVTSLFATLDHMKETELNFGYEPVRRTMSFSQGPKALALDYFRGHSVFQLFSFMMSHLLARTPEDPVPFLETLVDRCLRYRDQDDEPPLLFEDPHVQSLYTALDPLDDGCVKYGQYLTGMSTLGVTDFNIMPDDMDHYTRYIPQHVFLREAKTALLRQLDNVLGKKRKTASKHSSDDESKVNSSGVSSGNEYFGTVLGRSFEKESDNLVPKSSSINQPTIETMAFADL